MGKISRLSLGAAVAALVVVPAQGAELPGAAAPWAQADYATQTVLNDGADEAEQRRRYRYRRHRDRIDAGDVIAGALIIGGIFAVLNASNNRNDNRYDRDDISNDAFDNAVDACVDRVERDQRIGSVDNVGRTSRGYSVSGTLYSGAGFRCQVSGAGRVLDIDYGGGVTYQSGGETYGDGQYSDETYARLRSNTYSTPDSNAQPAYPGGPLPGEGDGGYADEYDEGTPY